MSIPHRGQTGQTTYFITADTYMKTFVLQSDRMCSLLVDVMYDYRRQGKYLVHEFVVMPNHLHLLITPNGYTIERCMQFIKGNFSHRASKELNFRHAIWQNSFYDRRVRNAAEYQRFKVYIHQNPVKARLVAKPADF